MPTLPPAYLSGVAFLLYFLPFQWQKCLNCRAHDQREGTFQLSVHLPWNMLNQPSPGGPQIQEKMASIIHCLPPWLAGGSGDLPQRGERRGDSYRRGCHCIWHPWLHKFSIVSGLTSAGGAQAPSPVEPLSGTLWRGLEIDS